MAVTLAFDVYGTLIDTDGVVARLREMVGDAAGRFSRAWRDRQLEYSFRRGLMRNYENFAVCTRQALDHTCSALGKPLTDGQKAELLRAYRGLPAYDDAAPALTDLRRAGCRMFAFSNGAAEAVEALLAAAGIREFFAGVVSTDELKSFKPDPAVYCHFLRRAGVAGDQAWLVSGNPFDVIGAISAGMRGVWVRRSTEAVFDPWGIEPTVTVSGLGELAGRIAAVSGRQPAGPTPP